MCPGDPVEAVAATKAIAEYPGTCYLRLGRGGERVVHTEGLDDFTIGKAIKIRGAKQGEKRIAVFSTGAILEETIRACNQLEAEGYGVEQYSFPTVKPIDVDVIQRCKKEFDYIVTVEEHNVMGGFGSAVAEVMAESDGNAKLMRIGMDDQYCVRVGNQQYLREQYGMDAQSIIKRIKEVL